MAKKVGMEVSLAISEVVALTDTDVIAAYPITPQTHIVEHLADLVAEGHLDARYITVESEHSVMSAMLGASAVGARTFTATSGQGLELMHEVLPVASAMRLPVIMVVADRALSAPLSVWGDHSDVMAERDTGWIQIFCENGQEALDQTLCAFHIGEDKRVLLPVMVHIDGFHLSHMIEAMLLPDKAEVDAFLPPFNYPLPLHPDKPLTMGAFAIPILYTEAKKAQEVNLEASYNVILEAWAKFEKMFGRRYQPVETYHGDAKTLLFTMGSFSETAMTAVDELRKAGRDVGVARLRLWRPFPFKEVRQAVGNAETLIILDRALSFGGPPGPFSSEVRAALYNLTKRPKVASFVGGLGGRDINVKGFETIVDQGLAMAQKGEAEYDLFGVRE